MIRSSACQPWQPDLPGHAGDRGDLLSYTTPWDTIEGEHVEGPLRVGGQTSKPRDGEPRQGCQRARPISPAYQGIGFRTVKEQGSRTPGTGSLVLGCQSPGPPRGSLCGSFSQPASGPAPLVGRSVRSAFAPPLR